MHYILIRKKHNKRMYLRIKDGQIVVSAPFHSTKRDIDSFVSNNEEWILKQLKKTKENTIKDGDILHFVNGNYLVHIDADLKRISIHNNEIFIRNQKDFEKILKHMASTILPTLFENVQRQLNIFNMTLKIGVYSSQWGSCNKTKREIHLNAYLIMTDYEFIHSVIVHEFAHMYVSNHSKQFYDVVYRWMPNYDRVHQKYKHYKFPKLEQ